MLGACEGDVEGRVDGNSEGEVDGCFEGCTDGTLKEKNVPRLVRPQKQVDKNDALTIFDY